MADLEVTGSLLVDQSTHIKGSCDIDVGLNVDGNSIMGGALAVAGELSADDITSVTSISGVTLSLTGGASIAGASSFDDAVTMPELHLASAIVGASVAGTIDLSGLAPKASPTFTSSTTTPLSVNGTASSQIAAVVLTSTANQGGVLRGRQQNAGATASAADDVFLVMGGLGFDGAAFAAANKASVNFCASQAWTASNQGTYITLNTTATNTTTRSEKMRIDADGNVSVGTAALATNATNGFLYIPSSAGAPIGTPTAKTGLVPMHYDSTNNNFYVYNGGAWKKVALT